MKKYVIDIIEEAKRQIELPIGQRDAGLLVLATVALKDHLNLLEEMLAEQKQELSRLKKDLFIDPLTGLYTRRGLERHLETIDMQRQYGLFVSDIANLKKVNDNFGISVGDYLIRSVAFGLRSALKAEDFICRYGYSKSDEFLIITGDSQNSQDISERISKIDVRLFERPYSATLHVGYTQYTPSCQKFEEAFFMASEMLNKQKKEKKSKSRRLH